MTAWRIWLAGKGDADTLARLETLAFGGRSWGEDSVKASFVASGVTVLMGADGDGAPQGFALWRDLGEEAELLTIGVVPQMRRSGLGDALIDAVMEAAKSGGAQRLFLEVGAENAAARALYARKHFRKIGLRKNYYRDGGDAVVMAVDL